MNCVLCNNKILDRELYTEVSLHHGPFVLLSRNDSTEVKPPLVLKLPAHQDCVDEHGRRSTTNDATVFLGFNGWETAEEAHLRAQVEADALKVKKPKKVRGRR